MRYFTGVGSRKAPQDILILMTSIASLLKKSYFLRTGDALGSDLAFTVGYGECLNLKVYTAHDAVPWALDMVKQCLPLDRSNFDGWNKYIKNLVGRNMMQVLGDNGVLPSDFVICYTPSLEYDSAKKCGGTIYAIKCALKHNIPIFNLFDEKVKRAFVKFTKENISIDEIIECFYSKNNI